MTRPSSVMLLGAAGGLLLWTSIGCKPQEGPCIHRFEEPVLQIQSATNVDTEEPIDRLYLKNVRPPVQWTEGMPSLQRSTNIEVDEANQRYVCTIPCAFGMSEGVYEFITEAEGYEPRSMEVHASYSEFDGGCPSYSDDGTRVNVRMKPAE